MIIRIKVGCYFLKGRFFFFYSFSGFFMVRGWGYFFGGVIINIKDFLEYIINYLFS